MFKKQRPKEEEEEEVIPEGMKSAICSACKQDMIIEKGLTVLECFGDGTQHSFTDNPKFVGIDAIPRKIEDWGEEAGLDEEETIFPPIGLQ